MTPTRDTRVPLHDRAYLLSDEKRNDILALWEVLQYGRDSFGDPDYVAVYGLRPADWYARGVRILARTAVECTRDTLADRIGRDVAALAARAPTMAGSAVLDLLAGSANTLYWIARHTSPQHAVGFEQDARVFDLTRRNLAIVEVDLTLTHSGFDEGLVATHIADDHLLIVFIAPPWGDALSVTAGLDLRHTTPPTPRIIDRIAHTFPDHKVLLAIQIHESVVMDSVTASTALCAWSSLNTYDLNTAGQNHGLLLGTLGWTP
jgi:16S rRNA G966 N2-methylase RsmD